MVHPAFSKQKDAAMAYRARETARGNSVVDLLASSIVSNHIRVTTSQTSMPTTRTSNRNIVMPLQLRSYVLDRGILESMKSMCPDGTCSPAGGWQ